MSPDTGKVEERLTAMLEEVDRADAAGVGVITLTRRGILEAAGVPDLLAENDQLHEQAERLVEALGWFTSGRGADAPLQREAEEVLASARAAGLGSSQTVTPETQ